MARGLGVQAGSAIWSYILQSHFNKPKFDDREALAWVGNPYGQYSMSSDYRLFLTIESCIVRCQCSKLDFSRPGKHVRSGYELDQVQVKNRSSKMTCKQVELIGLQVKLIKLCVDLYLFPCRGKNNNKNMIIILYLSFFQYKKKIKI